MSTLVRRSQAPLEGQGRAVTSPILAPTDRKSRKGRGRIATGAAAAALFLAVVTVVYLAGFSSNGREVAAKAKAKAKAASAAAANEEEALSGAPSEAAVASVRRSGGGGKPAAAIRSDLTKRDPNGLWDKLLAGSTSEAAEGKPVLEVGVHTPTQCIRAAELGFRAHCFEPSPKSFRRAEEGVKNARADVSDRIHLYNMAAGPTSGDKVPFRSTGGTGDHVGEFDMWNMKKVDQSNEDGNKDKKKGEIIEVPTIRLDDIVEKTGDVFLLKVDTQGFEPSVFSGLERSIEAKRLAYIIFEFWPRGMDLLGGTPDQCAAARLLDKFVAAGYKLYALQVESHPKAPLHGGRAMKKEVQNRPMSEGTDVYCRWFFELEDRFPSKEYKFGYWSDFLAVAPGYSVPDSLL